MDIRTFEAFSMKEAVKAVKKALGSDAVILSTKEKPAPVGQGTIYEVTAAQSSHPARVGARGASMTTVDPGLGASEQLETLNVRLTALSEHVSNRTQVQSLEAGLKELKLLLLENLRTKEGFHLHGLPAHLTLIERQLRVMGVDAVSVAELMKHLQTLPPPNVDSNDASDGLETYYRDQAIRWMIKRIKIAPRWAAVPGAISWQAIVGPTGVGKSSVIAKLAALYSKREKHRVAVASLDNRRLAASDQMRIYCKIIDVPFINVNDPSDLAAVAENHRDIEIVLIDTAGFSPKSQGDIERLEAIRTAGVPIDFHLCLAVTEKEEQMDQAVRAFSQLGLQSLIFSKLDESWSYGEIYNLSRRWTLPLSFFSIGQDIPDDIERASRERVIERIFGL